MLKQINLFTKSSLTNVATVDIFRAKTPVWVDGSMVFFHDVSVLRELASKALLAYLVRYSSVDLLVEMLIQSMLANEVLLAVTAPKLGGVKGL